MSAFRTLDDMDLAGKRVLVRVDLNVPMQNGAVSDDTRIRAVLPTINDISAKGGKVILLAHFGRPKGERKPDMSLEPIAVPLAERLGKPVAFASDCVGEPAATAIAAMNDGDVLLLENTRYHAGEEKNDADFTKALAENGDVYVNDAFSAAHRAHSSTEGLAHLLPSCAGRAMQKELDALEAALGKPERPVVAVVGGAKVSTKIDLLQNLVARVDALVIGGGMANTFLAADDIDVGKSLCEHDLADTARAIQVAAEKANCKLVLPVDAVVAAKLENGTDTDVVAVDAIPSDQMILDVGPDTLAEVMKAFDGAKTVVWNGPLGAFEFSPFDRATVSAARHAASLTSAGKLLSVAGGGDTVAALNHAGVGDKFSYVSTAGGAFLEWLEGKPLPGVDALRK
ncbi:MAG: phosphoglycerate kinase [Hyphomicrobiales bacterium]|nr:MAG: phosphoglycerate kinase [Hyphomicrobiales bacterium]